MASRSIDTFDPLGNEPQMASRSIVTFDPLGNDEPRPASILLCDRPYISVDGNETTAAARSIGGHTMAVSLWIADPPGMSFFSVTCSKPLNSDPKSADFRVFPRVVGAEGRFVLLRARFFFFLSPDEYFMYKASDAESPSLDSVPLPPPDADADLRRVREFGIVPRCNGGHYLLTALCEAHDAPLDYKLHTYSSERKTWSSITLLNPCTEVKRIIPEKVITIGEGVLGWVDFSCGLLVCNLNEDPPNADFIPLPLPLPGNKDKLRASLTSGHSPRLFRDIACVDGVLKFIEVENRVIDIMPEKSSDPSDKGLLYDSDLIMSLKRKEMDEKPKKQQSGYGWRAVTWSRTILSNCWHKERTIDVSDFLRMPTEVSDIFAAESTYSSVPSGLQAKSLEEWKLYSSFPTFRMDGGDIFYLKSTVEPNDRDGLVVSVDLENKMAKLFGAWSFAKPKRGYFSQAFRSCTLSNHLKMTPGIKASAYRNIRQAGSCSDDPKAILSGVFHFTSFKYDTSTF